MVEQPTIEPKKRSKRPLIILIVALVVVVVAGGLYFNNYNNGPCGVARVKSSTNELRLIAQKWDDANKIASSTSRIALSGPVSSMQSTMRDTTNLEVPGCMVATKDALLSSMDSTINGYIAFMGQKDDKTVNTYFTNASNYLDSFGNELNKVSACAPNCQ